jgi:5-methylcytosine-specific restriction endonuclease McrA
VRRKPLERRTPLKARSELKRGSGLKRPAPKRRGSISPATPAQRARVKDRACIVCAAHPCDPAHLIDRSLAPSAGDDVRMVVPLCRPCHHDYDEGDRDLSPYLEPYWRDAIACAVEAIGLFRALKRITKSTSVVVPSEEAA